MLCFVCAYGIIKLVVNLKKKFKGAVVRMGMIIKNVSEKMSCEEIMNLKISKSSKMKKMFCKGMEVGEISKIVGTRYNFVYNVVSNWVTMEEIEVVGGSNGKGGKKKEIMECLDKGMEVKEICRSLKCNMNYIYKIKKEWEKKEVVDVKKKK